MDLLSLSILFPLIIAVALLVPPKESVRNITIKSLALLIAAASVYSLAAAYNSGTTYYNISAEPISQAVFYAEMILALSLMYLAAKHKNALAALLLVVQVLVLFELNYAGGLQAETITNSLLLSAMLVAVILAIEMKNLLKSAIALGAGSTLLSVVFYVLGAPTAAVFELSVCAGLVTILLLAAIGMFEKEESK